MMVFGALGKKPQARNVLKAAQDEKAKLEVQIRWPSTLSSDSPLKALERSKKTLRFGEHASHPIMGAAYRFRNRATASS
jgi:hypothetical protein